MNTHAINGQAIGNGGTDTRVFLILSTLARATSSAAIYAVRYMSAAVTPRATIAARLDGVFQMAGFALGRATGVITTTAYYAKYLSASVIAQASQVSLIFKQAFLDATAIVGASQVSTLYRMQNLGATVTVTATTSGDIGQLGFPADEERQMILSSEDRKMKVA